MPSAPAGTVLLDANGDPLVVGSTVDLTVTGIGGATTAIGTVAAVPAGADGTYIITLLASDRVRTIDSTGEVRVRVPDHQDRDFTIDVTVTSASLSAGTAVDVRFVFELAFSAGTASSQANSSVNAVSRMHVQSVASGVTGIDADENRYFDSTETGDFIQNGIFTGDHRVEYTIGTTVGSTFAWLD